MKQYIGLEDCSYVSYISPVEWKAVKRVERYDETERLKEALKIGNKIIFITECEELWNDKDKFKTIKIMTITEYLNKSKVLIYPKELKEGYRYNMILRDIEWLKNREIERNKMVNELVLEWEGKTKPDKQNGGRNLSLDKWTKK